MWKTFLGAVLVTAGLSGAAMADTVTVETKTNFSTPDDTLTSKNTLHFKGTQEIQFDVAGKTCTLTGSASGAVPMGCNYLITVNPDGSISGVLHAGNAVCTQSGQIAASCK